MARLALLDAQTYTFQDGTRLKDIPTEELLETYTQADSLFIGLASEYASEEEIKNLREKYDNLTRHSDLWNDGDESKKNDNDIRTDIMEFDHLRRFTYENHLNEKTGKPEKETVNFKDFDEWEENLIENMTDKEIERTDANVGMSEDAMEAEIAAEENSRPDFIDEQGNPHWFDEKEDYDDGQIPLEVVDRSEMLYFNSDKVSVREYKIRIDEGLFSQLVPEQYSETNFSDGEIPAITYRQSTNPEVPDQFLISKFKPENYNYPLIQTTIEIKDEELLRQIKFNVENYEAEWQQSKAKLEAVNAEEETEGNESTAPEKKEEAEENKEEKKAGFFKRLFGEKEKPAGETPSETPEEKNNGEEKSEPEKESGNGKMEEGQFYQVTFSFKNAEGGDEEIKAVYAIAPNSKENPSLRCANNKEEINEAFPYTDTTLPAGDENIENNRRARGLNGFPPGILNNDDLLEAWNKRLNDPNMKIKLPPFPEGTSEMKVSVENITKKLEKTRGENIPAEEKKAETAEGEEAEEESEKKPTVPVPEKLRRDGIANERPVSEEDYTELLYLRSKEIFMLADEDRNMAEEDKKFFKKLWKAYSETDGSEKEMRKAFDSYIRNPDNENDITGMGICMEKHILSNQGFKRNIPAEIKYNADTQLMAVKNNKHPLQIAGIPPLIFNPEENSIYRGCAQMLLQTNNNINGMNEKAYVTASQAQQAGGMMLPNYKASTLLVPHGQDSRGRYVYQMLVPCSALAKRNAEKEMRKLEKDQVKLAYKNALNELKFFKKHHMLPLYRINMTSDPLPPQANISDINIGFPPPADAPIEKIVEHDTKAFLAAALTQTQYTPTVDYTKSPYKEALEQFIKKNPQKTIENQNQSYLEIGQQIQEARDKANGTENKQEETRTQGNAIVPKNKNENVNQKSNGHGRRTGGRR